MGVGGRRHAPAALSPAEGPGARCMGGWMGHMVGLDGGGKSRPTAIFLKYSPELCLYFIRTLFFVCIVLHFTLLSLLKAHNTNTHAPGGIRTRIPSN